MATAEEQYYRRGDGGDRSTYDALATGLGWFSIALGVAEVAAPGSLAQLVGLRDDDSTRSTLRTYGVREIANGVAILQGGSNPAWMWTRLGGDVLDAATLLRALDDPSTDRGRVLTAVGAVAGVGALDALCAAGLSRAGRSDSTAIRPRQQVQHGIRVRKTFTINRQPDAVYGFWRRLENLPQFMRHLESVEVLDDRRSRWRAKAPGGMTVQWEAEITSDQPNEQISWQSLKGSTVPNRGTVRFVPAPGARGTELHVDLEYSVPGGRLTSTLAKLFGREPEQQISDDLRRLKQLLEAGEIARSAGSTSLSQPAQPNPALVRRQMASEGVKR